MADPLASLQAHILMVDQKRLIVPAKEQVDYLEGIAKFASISKSPWIISDIYFFV